MKWGDSLSRGAPVPERRPPGSYGFVAPGSWFVALKSPAETPGGAEISERRHLRRHFCSAAQKSDSRLRFHQNRNFGPGFHEIGLSCPRARQNRTFEPAVGQNRTFEPDFSRNRTLEPDFGSAHKCAVSTHTFLRKSGIRVHRTRFSGLQLPQQVSPRLRRRSLRRSRAALFQW